MQSHLMMLLILTFVWAIQIIVINIYLPASYANHHQGTYSLSLKPDNLLLNYEPWTVSPNNSITITPEQVLANNFILSKGPQQLALQSAAGSGLQPLNVNFTNFRLSTITGFIKSDSLLVDGSMNGVITFKNLMQQPVFTSNLTINDLSFKQDTIGNVAFQVSTSGNSYTTNATITGRGNDVALSGSFTPQGTSDIALDLDLAIRQLQIKYAGRRYGHFCKIRFRFH